MAPGAIKPVLESGRFKAAQPSCLSVAVKALAPNRQAAPVRLKALRVPGLESAALNRLAASAYPSSTEKAIAVKIAAKAIICGSAGWAESMNWGRNAV